MRLLEPARDGRWLAAVKIDLGAIARRQDRRFADDAPRRELPQPRGQRVGRERDPLAHVEWRRRVVEAERVEGHACGWTSETGRELRAVRRRDRAHFTAAGPVGASQLVDLRERTDVGSETTFACAKLVSDLRP